MAGEHMFGSPIGTHIFNTEQASMLKTGVDAMHKLGEIAMQPAKLREQEAEAGLKELDLQNQKKMQEILAARAAGRTPVGKDGKEISMADEISALAMDSLNAGLLTQGEDLAAASSLIRSREARADASRIAADESKVRAAAQRAALEGQLLANPSVVDQATWEQAQAAYFVQTGEAPYAGMPYSQDLIKQIRANALSTKEAADLEEKRLTREAREKREKALEAIRKQELEVKKKEQETREAAEARRKKAGQDPKPVTPAGKEETAQATRLIKRDYPELEGMDLNDAAFSIANAAKYIRQRNPAISPEIAIQQAFNDAKAGGDFKTTELGALEGWSSKGKQSKRTVYLGRGKTVATPLPAPQKPGDAVEGKYYQLPNGQVGKRVKGGWDISTGLSANNSRVDPEDNDDEDDGE